MKLILIISAIFGALSVVSIIMGWPMIVLLFCLVMCGFTLGLCGGGSTRDQVNSDNLAQIAQIERNRYFRKQD